MILTLQIDTNDITDSDRALLVLLAAGRQVDPFAAQLATGEDTSAEKPKRTRRTAAQKAADEAAAKAAQATAPADEPTPDSENAESEQETTQAEPTPETDDKASIEKLVEVATALATSDRSALVAILEAHGVKRASQVPAEDRAAVIAQIETALQA